jgi:hypothetical protein
MQKIYSKADAQSMDDAAKAVVDTITAKLNALFNESYLVKMIQSDSSALVTLYFEKIANDNIVTTSVAVPKELLNLES